MKNISFTTPVITLIIANLIPVFGVLFLGWEPLTVFVVYVLESIVAGIFNVIKMLTVYFSADKDVALRKEPGDSGVAGLGLVPFFIVHYFFFVFIQCALFFAFAGIGKESFSLINLVENFKPYIMNDSGWAVGGIVLSYAMSYAFDFMLSGEFSRTSMSQLFFRPYKRIVVQQFVVLLGGFVFMFTSGFLPKAGVYAFVTIFTGVKIFIDLVLEKKLKETHPGVKFD